ncbi:hypothetical protein ACSFBI_03575 [Variovorax sp. RB3P1]|uniref:hypothetical protein n=1 Tax=Variovorax sp. RB3P1 TaxID=3443732 RepID=UPI003F458F62
MAKVVLLRERGAWRSRNQVLGPPHFAGELIYGPANREHWGPTKHARLIDPDTPKIDLVKPLQYAKLIVVREGGAFIRGVEFHHRGVKSKPEPRDQMWWCMFDLKRALAALARMDARSSSGFHTNDDDYPW